MFPLSDESPLTRPPVGTYLLLAAMFAVWILVQGGGLSPLRLATTVCDLGMVPGEITHQAPLGQAVPIGYGMACVVDNQAINIWTPLISMFLHGGWAHILGNALFFWVFGRSIEDSMGTGRFIAFYLISGLAAAAVYIAMEPASPVPTVGASGAISGVLGAYLVLYPRVRVKMLFWWLIFIQIFRIPAWIVLLYWFAVQVLTALPSLSQLNPQVSGGVAVWAHIGGFLTGVVLVKLFENRERVARRMAMRAARLSWPVA